MHRDLSTGEEKSSEIPANKAGFEAKSIDNLSQNMSIYGELAKYAVSVKGEFTERERSTPLVCKVCNAMS